MALDLEWEKIVKEAHARIDEELQANVHAPMGTYERLGLEIGRLVAAKQKQYGDSFGRAGDVMRIFYPNGIMPDQYDDALALTRIVDKQFRIANGSQGEESPYKDISGYGLLGWAREERGK